MSNILITGGAGYIGSVLVGQLLTSGHEVTVLDSFLYQNQYTLLTYIGNDKLRVIEGDARDRKTMEDSVMGMDVIIPLAAIVGAPACDRKPFDAISLNQSSIATLLQVVQPGQYIIFPATNSGYGIGKPGVPCDENSPINPISLYGKTKVDAEKAVMERSWSVSLRFATAFGVSHRMRRDLLVNDFVYRAIEDRYLNIFEPHFKRNFVHVRDIARAIDFTINRLEDMDGQIYNVGLSDCNLTKLQLAEKIQQHLPETHIHISDTGTDPDKRDYIVSNDKIERLGFKPCHTLDDGIQELIRAHPLTKSYYSTNA